MEVCKFPYLIKKLKKVLIFSNYYTIMSSMPIQVVIIPSKKQRKRRLNFLRVKLNSPCFSIFSTGRPERAN